MVKGIQKKFQKCLSNSLLSQRLFPNRKPDIPRKNQSVISYLKGLIHSAGVAS
jgi:hypothetical protein